MADCAGGCGEHVGEGMKCFTCATAAADDWITRRRERAHARDKRGARPQATIPKRRRRPRRATKALADAGEAVKGMLGG